MIRPRCKMGFPQYISAEGQWFPCCFVSQIQPQSGENWFQMNREHFQLGKRSLAEILTGPKLEELEKLWNNDGGRDAPYWCRVMCADKSGGNPISVKIEP